MLNLMRKKAGSWLIKVILFAIVVVFIFWGFGSYRSRRTTQVADINGTIITYDAYRQTYQRLLEQYRRIYGARLNDDMLKLLRLNDVALDQMVQRVLMLQEAERLGLQVTPPEIAAAIHQISAFQNDGVFDFERYSTILGRNNLTTEVFEKDQEEEILLDRLRAMIVEGVTVTDADAHQWYDWQNAQINLTYLLFSPNRYPDALPTDEEISTYYTEHANNYKTQPQVKARYLFFDSKAYEQDISIGGEDIERYYYGHTDEFYAEKTVQARHILFKLESDADEQTIETQRAKALDVYEMAKKGQPFDELAKQYSEGPSRDNGGDLGTFTRDTMVKPFADKAFTMTIGEISEPVRTQFGWHIIKVEQLNPATTQSLENAGDGIKVKLLSEKSREMALEKAEFIYDSLFDGDDLSLIEQSNQVILGTTDFFSAQNPPQKQIADGRKFAETALALDTLSISDILKLDNGYYLLQVTDRMEPTIPSLEDIIDRVTTDVTKMKQDEKAKADARAALAELHSDKVFTDVAATYGLQIQETGFFNRTGAIPQIGYEPAINGLGFALTLNKPLVQEAARVQAGWLVFSLKERKAPEEAGFEKEKERTITRLTDQKRQETLETWLEELKARGTIEINTDLIR